MYMQSHQLLWIYKQLYTYQKKKLSEGSLGVHIFIYLSYRDYLQRGVKTGINYPHTCLSTCIRVTKIPVWPTIVAENKDFCQSNLPLGGTFLRTPKQLKDAWLALAWPIKRPELTKVSEFTLWNTSCIIFSHLKFIKVHFLTLFWLFGHWISPKGLKWPPGAPTHPNKFAKLGTFGSRF